MDNIVIQKPTNIDRITTRKG